MQARGGARKIFSFTQRCLLSSRQVILISLEVGAPAQSSSSSSKTCGLDLLALATGVLIASATLIILSRGSTTTGSSTQPASRQPMPRHGPLKGDDPQRGVVGSSPAGAAVPSTQYGSGLTLRGYGLRYYFATFSLRTTPRAATRRPDMREKGRPHDAVSPSPTLARRCAPIAPPGWLFSTSAAVSSLRAAHSHSRALKMW